jgi:hypothetical protein
MYLKLTSIVLLLIISSCKGGGGGGGGGKNEESDASPPEPVTYNVKDEHLGLWAACINDFGDNTSMLYTYSLSSYSLTSAFIYYSNVNCQTANLVFEERFVSEVLRDDTKHTTYLVGASSKSLVASDVTYNNTNSYCGFNDWVLNTPKNILGRNCMGNTNTTGDMGEFYLSKNGTALVVTGETDNPIELQPIHRPNFNHSDTPISNGTYGVLYNDISYLYELNNGNYTIHAHNVKDSTYYQQSGTYSVSENIVTFTMASESPNCGTIVGDEFGLYYSPYAVSLILKNVKNDIMVAEALTWTSTQFINAYSGEDSIPGCL